MHMDIVVEQTPGEVKTDLVKKKKKPARFGKPVDDGDLNKLIQTQFHQTQRRAHHGP